MLQFTVSRIPKKIKRLPLWNAGAGVRGFFDDSPEACKDLAFNILGGRQKLFGILAIIGKLSTIKDLLAEKLCDQDLPLRLPNSSTAGTNAMLHKIETTTGRSLQVFSPWTTWELDEFRRV
jgi:hypothetical protein